ncbi:uncharacterized protein [Hyperolius riggenbachi]|uniref:uncharacterized protein n=1 Tax=Hyperolius riggenbachi TaxID=752182 RepID=UPI0035A2B51B
MASQSILQSGNSHHFTPVPSHKPEESHQHKKLDEDELPEDNQEVLQHLENSFVKMKDKTEQKKRKKYKKCNYFAEEQDLDILYTDTENFECSIPRSSSNKKKRSPLEFLENLPPQQESQTEKANEIIGLPSPVNVKKLKRKKRVNFETHFSDNCSQLGKQPSPHGWSSEKKLKDHTTESLSSSLSSPTSLPKAFLVHKIGVHVKGEDRNSISDHSQELFITQKHFLAPDLPSCGSDDSPPLGQECQYKGIMKRRRSQSSSSKLRSPQSFFQNNVHSRVKQENFGAVLVEKSTQTDNIFSYLSLLTFLKKDKVLETCAEQPLDLSLPHRIRASSTLSLISAKDEDVIIVGSSSAKVKRKSKLISSPPHPLDESKFVQSILNSSYFFKGKGENGDFTPITPIIKMKEQPRKFPKKSPKTKKHYNRA